jgi:hypothetical protein
MLRNYRVVFWSWPGAIKRSAALKSPAEILCRRDQQQKYDALNVDDNECTGDLAHELQYCSIYQAVVCTASKLALHGPPVIFLATYKTLLERNPTLNTKGEEDSLFTTKIDGIVNIVDLDESQRVKDDHSR